MANGGLLKVPAVYEHCIRVYDAMLERSKVREFHGRDVPVYEGRLVKLFEELGYSLPYYTLVTKELRRMECAVQIKRGGGGSPSQWVMVRQPTPQIFQEARKKTVASRAAKFEVLEQQIRALHLRVAALEDAEHLRQLSARVAEPVQELPVPTHNPLTTLTEEKDADSGGSLPMPEVQDPGGEDTL